MRVEDFSNHELTVRLSALVRKEREVSADILLHLNEVEKRRLHLEEGYPSLFVYCTKKLGYSESAANRRIMSARCVRDYPLALSMLRDGRVTLTTLSLVAGSLSAENHRRLLESVSGKSRSEVEEVLAELHVKPRMMERVRPVFVLAEPKVAKPVAMSAPSVVEDPAPVTKKRFALSYSVSEEVHAKLNEAKALLSSRYPEGVSLEMVLEALLDDFLERHAPAKKMQRRAKKPEGKIKEPVVRNRHIPTKTRDEVFVRDGGRCSYVGPNGVRCNSTHNLQIDHRVTFAGGGSHSADNLRLVCAAHNRHLAVKSFGKRHMRKYLAL